MKRFLLFLIILGAAGYAAYVKVPAFKVQVDKIIARLEAFAPKDGAANETADETAAPGSVAGSTPFASRMNTATAPDAPEAPKEKQFAPPGVFYMTERVSAETKTGVQAVVPGDQVKLLQRLPGNRMRVTSGGADFEIKDSQATNDLDVAREAEKADFLSRGGKL